MLFLAEITVVTLFVMNLLINVSCQEYPVTRNPQDSVSEDVRLNFTQLAFKYLGACQDHDVLTDDGYVLKLFRVPGDPARPVLLLHGALGSADDFMIRGRTSLVADLSRAGHDVWVANVRGNKYSRRHVNFTTDDPKFWDFGLDEIATLDVSAMIDYVLLATGQRQLTAIGFSVGTSTFYALAADRPDYNDKIKLMISLAPIYYMYHSVPLAVFHPTIAVLGRLLESLGVDEVSPSTVGLKLLVDSCIRALGFFGRPVASFVCLSLGWAFAPGFNVNEIEAEFTPVILAHFPTSSSRKYAVHFSQLGINRRFAKYDFGWQENLMRYGSVLPPEYDMSRVTMRVALISAKHDAVSTLRDVQLLKPKLRNCVSHILLEPRDFNHADFIFSKHAYRILHPYIFYLIQMYT